MKKKERVGLFVCGAVVALLALFACEGAGAARNGGLQLDEVVVTWRVTGMSVLGPELQVLIENHAAREVAVAVAVDREKRSIRDACNFVRRDTFGEDYRELAIWDIRERMSQFEVRVAPKEWGHVAFYFGKSGISEPCNVLLSVSTENLKQEAVIPIQTPSSEYVPDHPDRPTVQTSTVVQEDERGSRQVFVKTRVLNTSPRKLEVSVRERALICPDGVGARWSLTRDVPQGMAAGPTILQVNEWVVFTQVVEFDLDVKPDVTCKALLRVANSIAGFGGRVVGEDEVVVGAPRGRPLP